VCPTFPVELVAGVVPETVQLASDRVVAKRVQDDLVDLLDLYTSGNEVICDAAVPVVETTIDGSPAMTRGEEEWLVASTSA
jgi:hypothetical protein